MRISDWSSDVCSSDLDRETLARDRLARRIAHRDAIDPQHQPARYQRLDALARQVGQRLGQRPIETPAIGGPGDLGVDDGNTPVHALRSEEHTSELQSLMRISYAVFCLKKKNTKNTK